MTYAVRLAAGVLAALAAVAVPVALWRQLQIGVLLEGFGEPYRLADLAVAAAGGAAVGACLAALRHVRRTASLSPLLLAGPVLLALLVAERWVPSQETSYVYDGSYVPLGVSMSQAYSSDLEIVFRSRPLDLGLLVLAVAVGAGLPAWASRRTRRAGTPQA